MQSVAGSQYTILIATLRLESPPTCAKLGKWSTYWEYALRAAEQCSSRENHCAKNGFNLLFDKDAE